MSATFKNFTPAPDVIVQELGPTEAIVYGKVWRYCRMEKRQCFAKLETIGKALNMSRKTIERHMKVLVEHGYIQDLDTGVKNRPHRYIITGKVQALEISVSMNPPDPQSLEDSSGNVGQTKSPSGSDKKSDRRSDKKSVEDTEQKDTEEQIQVPSEPGKPEDPEPELPPTPVNLGEWLTQLTQEKNKVAYLVFAYATLFPEAPALDFGKMGVFQRRVGGPAQMLRYCYQFSGQELNDPLPYIAKTHENRTKKTGSDNERSNTSKGTEEHEPTVQEKVKRAIDHARKQSGTG